MVKLGDKEYEKLNAKYVRNALTRRPIFIGSPTYKKYIKEGWVLTGSDGHKLLGPPKININKIKEKVKKVDRQVKEFVETTSEYQIPPKKSSKKITKLHEKIARVDALVQNKDNETIIVKSKRVNVKPILKDGSIKKSRSITIKEPSEIKIEELKEEVKEQALDEKHEAKEEIKTLEQELIEFKEEDKRKDRDLVINILKAILNIKSELVAENSEKKNYEDLQTIFAVEKTLKEVGADEYVNKVQETEYINDPEIKHLVEMIEDADHVNNFLEQENEDQIYTVENGELNNKINDIYISNDFVIGKQYTKKELAKIEQYIRSIVLDHRVEMLSFEEQLLLMDKFSRLIKLHKLHVKGGQLPINDYLFEFYHFITFLKHNINLLIHNTPLNALIGLYTNPTKNEEYEEQFKDVHSEIENIDEELKGIHNDIKELYNRSDEMINYKNTKLSDIIQSIADTEIKELVPERFRVASESMPEPFLDIPLVNIPQMPIFVEKPLEQQVQITDIPKLSVSFSPDDLKQAFKSLSKLNPKKQEELKQEKVEKALQEELEKDPLKYALSKAVEKIAEITMGKDEEEEDYGEFFD